MIYLSGIHSDTIADHAARQPLLGLMAQPRSALFHHLGRYRTHAYDNGAFGDFTAGREFQAAPWLRGLDRLGRERLLFAVVPDAVGDHEATVAAWQLWAPEVLSRQFPAAFVLQNGCTDLAQVPAEASAVFIGGDDAYKLGSDAAHVCWQARRAGLWVHMGRVNSGKRWLRAMAMGCDSADGTFLRFGPHATQLARVDEWLRLGARSGGQLDLTDHVGGAA